MSATYGRGVHEFFAHRLTDADHQFTRVIDAGTTDPRVYYFRAMTRLKMGQQYEAEMDMRVGAAYEARDPGNRHVVGVALQRIQGHERRTLERFRREARLNYIQQRRQQVRSRYERLKQRAPEVLRREAPVPLNQLVEPAPSTAPAPQEGVVTEMPAEAASESPTPAEADIFAQPSPQPAEPEAAADDSSDDLFGDASPTPAPGEGGEDPFADSSEMKAEAEDETAEAGSAPFTTEAQPTESESSDTEDDPFGGSDSSESSDDPFGTDEPSDETEPPATEESSEPAEAEDPFASTSSDESSPPTELAESDKVESNKLIGVLGRVVGSTVPWRNVQLPEVPRLPGAGMDGPENSDEQITAAAPGFETEGVQPASAEEDLFGATAGSDSTNETSGDAPEDPFGATDTDSEIDALDSSEESSEELPAQEEDPFGSF